MEGGEGGFIITGGGPTTPLQLYVNAASFITIHGIKLVFRIPQVGVKVN